MATSLIPILAIDGDGDDLGDFIGFLIFGGLGLIFLLIVGISFYSRWRVGTPEVLISNTTLKVGEPFTASIDHQFRGKMQINSIQVQLVFRETATYQQGTDTRTVTHNHVIENFEYPGGNYGAGQYFQQSYDLQIPADGMHSLDVRRNKLTWLFILKMDIPRLPDFKNEYELIVLPELAANTRDDIWS